MERENETATVRSVIALETLPLGVQYSRRAVVEWSDGTIGEAARWWHEEVRLTEGDLLGATHDAIQQKIARRDRDWLADG